MFDQFDLVENRVIVWAVFAPGLLKPALVFLNIEDFRDFVESGLKFCDKNTIKTPEYIKKDFGER